MTSSAASETESARNRTSGSAGAHGAQDGETTTVGHVHVEQHDVGQSLDDELDGGVDLVGFTDDVDVSGDLGADARADQLVVVDEEDARSAHAVDTERDQRQVYLGARRRRRRICRLAAV